MKAQIPRIDTRSPNCKSPNCKSPAIQKSSPSESAGRIQQLKHLLLCVANWRLQPTTPRESDLEFGPVNNLAFSQACAPG
jgi:hypothetical protein